MCKNLKLRKARRIKNDEFYTSYKDIADEFDRNEYSEKFKGKFVLCNCNDGENSNFFKYFVLNFHRFGLRKLACASYGFQAHGYVCLGETSENGNPLVRRFPLKGDGSYRSPEMLELLRRCDVVVTNPPFSLFRDFMSLINDYEKEYCVLGNLNAVTYKEIFCPLKEGKMSIGFAFNKNMYFKLPDGNRKDVSCAFFTNMKLDKKIKTMEFDKKYDENFYEKYDWMPNVINVKKTCDIPYDYGGVMAVPITYLTYHNPNMFEILDLTNRYCVYDSQGVNEKVRAVRSHCCNINGKSTYNRILIKRIKK